MEPRSFAGRGIQSFQREQRCSSYAALDGGQANVAFCLRWAVHFSISRANATTSWMAQAAVCESRPKVAGSGLLLAGVTAVRLGASLSVPTRSNSSLSEVCV